MNKLPPPDVPGDNDPERFSNAVKMVFAVPAEAIKKEKKRIKRATVRRKKARERVLSR